MSKVLEKIEKQNVLLIFNHLFRPLKFYQLLFSFWKSFSKNKSIYIYGIGVGATWLKANKSNRSELVKATKSPKSVEFAQNLVSIKLTTATVFLTIVRNPRLFSWVKIDRLFLFFIFFISFSRVGEGRGGP
jgi:hypothetical protein